MGIYGADDFAPPLPPTTIITDARRTTSDLEVKLHDVSSILLLVGLAAAWWAACGLAAAVKKQQSTNKQDKLASG
jgi:hypothetical protein